MPDGYELHVRQIRVARGERLVDVAKVADISAGWLSLAERGVGLGLRLEALVRLARAWQIPPGQLVTFPEWPCLCACHAHGEEERTP